MRIVGKIIGIVLLVAVVLALLFVGFTLLCRGLDWCQGMVDWVESNIFSPIGIVFKAKQ